MPFCGQSNLGAGHARSPLRAEHLGCSGDYTITDDEVAEIEALGDDCIAITDLLEDCWDDTSVDCQVYELEIDELADEYLGCDMR